MQRQELDVVLKDVSIAKAESGDYIKIQEQKKHKTDIQPKPK
jgi:hypothetical protein